jgi:hypothetical protein
MWDLWWRKWPWGRLSSSTSVSPANLHSTNFSKITITYHPGPPHKLKKKLRASTMIYRWGVDSWCNMLQAGRSWVRFTIRSLIFFFNWRNPSSSTMALGSTQPLAEMSTRNLPGGERPAVTSGWQLHHHIWAYCLQNVGALAPHNPMGLHGLLQEYIYLYL